jgi:hypothetical protein
MERFNLKKLSYIEGKGRYCVEISNRFAALENLDTEVVANIKFSAKDSLCYYEPKKNKPWFDGCLKLLDQRK